jgi:hypothetical protein
VAVPRVGLTGASLTRFINRNGMTKFARWAV